MSFSFCLGTPTLPLCLNLDRSQCNESTGTPDTTRTKPITIIHNQIFMLAFISNKSDIGSGQVYSDPKPNTVEIGFGCLKLDPT